LGRELFKEATRSIIPKKLRNPRGYEHFPQDFHERGLQTHCEWERWGTEVFEEDGSRIPWRGRLRGGALLLLLNQVKEETYLVVAVGFVEKWKNYEPRLLS
jgi:hypothetical protein